MFDGRYIYILCTYCDKKRKIHYKKRRKARVWYVTGGGGGYERIDIIMYIKYKCRVFRATKRKSKIIIIIISNKNDLHGRFRVAVRRQTFNVDVRDADRIVAVSVFDGSAGAGA